MTLIKIFTYIYVCICIKRKKYIYDKTNWKQDKKLKYTVYYKHKALKIIVKNL